MYEFANQVVGRREFSSKDVVSSLAQHTEGLIQWLSLEGDKDRGVMMIKTLEEATRTAPAQYQFTHLSFQEGPYLLLVEPLLATCRAPTCYL